jgi:Na+/phosphate symporter
MFLSRQMAHYLLFYWLALVGVPLLFFALGMQLGLTGPPESPGLHEIMARVFMAAVGLYFVPFGYLLGSIAYSSPTGVVLVLTGYSIAAVGLAAITTWMRNRSRPPQSPIVR